jgi:inner membrane transporter RhtA
VRGPGSRVLAVLALLLAIVSVQTGATLAKQLFPLLGPQGTTALRQGFSALILCSLFRVWRSDFARLNWRVLVLFGVSLGVMNVTFYLAIARIPLGIAVALEFLGPLTVAILTSRRWIDFVWIACVGVGLAWLLPLGSSVAGLDPAGIALALVAGTFWGVYIVVGQKAGAAMHGGTVVALGMLVSALFTVPIGIAHSGALLLSPQVIPLALGVAVLSSAIPYSVEMFALTRLPARTFSLMMSLEPAVAAASGFVFLGERLRSSQILAVGLIIIASAGSSLTSRAQEHRIEV